MRIDEYRQVAGQSESDVQKGTGLGLSITNKFAQLLGGSIEVSSSVGEGSVFTIRVPLIYSEA
jgi:signal transduction histidine kinase